MRTLRILLITGLLFIITGGTTLAMSSLSYDLSWTALSGGGIENRSSPNYILGDTAGQSSAIGPSESENYRLGGGFWYGFKPESGQEEQGEAWYLDDDSTMYRGDTDNDPDTFPIADGGSQTWLSDETAVGDYTFPGGDWQVQIILQDALASGEQLTVAIGSSAGSDFDAAGNGSHTFVGNGTDTIFTMSFTVESFTVDSGDYLALKIDNPSEGSRGDITIKTGLTHSYCQAPFATPSFPLPELASIILLIAGFAMLGFYIWLRRRRKGAAYTE